MGFYFEVKDKNDWPVMRLSHIDDRCKFEVRYPDYKDCNCSKYFGTPNIVDILNLTQVGMLVWAYNPLEFRRLDKEFGEYIENKNKKDLL